MGSAFANSCAKSKQKKENNTNIITPASNKKNETEKISSQKQEMQSNDTEQRTHTKQNVGKEEEALNSKQEEGLNSKYDETLNMTAPNSFKTNDDRLHPQKVEQQVQQQDDHQVTPEKRAQPDFIIDEDQYKKENTDGYLSRESFFKAKKFLQEENELQTEVMKKENWVPGKTPDKILGKGSFGTVVLGSNKNTGEVVAVKLIETKDDRQKKFKSISEEVIILKRLRHKNIVRYLGILEHRGKDHIGIVCEYVSGGSLWRLIQKFEKFNEILIRKYTTDILYGLQYLHYHGITHRDIKAANILVDTDGVCKLADFGLARCVSSEIEEGQMQMPQGTPNWMAPEVCRFGKANSRFSDIWSLGCTLYEMIQGYPPYQELLPESIILKVGLLKTTPPYLQNLQVSEKLQDFLLHCFQIKPEDRWNVDQLLQHPFITDTDSGVESKSINNTRKRNAYGKNTYKKSKDQMITSSSSDNVAASISEVPTKHEQYIQQQQWLNQQPNLQTHTPVFTVNVKNNQNKRDSLKTILEESNQQYTGLEENTETNIRMRGPSIFHEEYSFAENNIKDISVLSNGVQNNNTANELNINGQSILKTSTTREMGGENSLYNTDQKHKSQKFKSVNSNAFLRDDAEEDQEAQNQEENKLPTNSNSYLISRDDQNSNKSQQQFNANFTSHKIDEVEEGDEEENMFSLNQIQDQSVKRESQTTTKKQSISSSKKMPSKSKIKTKASDDFEEEENEMMNSKCLRGIPTERGKDEKIEVKINNVSEYNISNLSKQKHLAGSKSYQFEFTMPIYEDILESPAESPEKKQQSNNFS